MPTQHIAFYGKGGGGTSTVASNVSAVLAEAGYRVILIGCDPQNDSTRTLRGGNDFPTVLEALQKQSSVRIEDVSTIGFNGILCIEALSLFQSEECAGRGIGKVFSFFKKIRLFEEYKPDFVLYDLPAEVVCSAFSFPSGKAVFERAYVVSSSDFLSLNTTNNIFRAIRKYTPAGGARLGGIIANGLTATLSESIVKDFAVRTGTRVVTYLPHSMVVIQSELYGQTVIEAAPQSNHAFIYRKLARQIIENRHSDIPDPFTAEELRIWAREWGDWIFELESGIITEGSAI
jgi:nitrogenase iron protein NifH